MREDTNAHGVRGGSPPKGGEPHHPHGGIAHGSELAMVETIWLIDGEPSHDLIWGGGHDRFQPFDGDRRVACTTLNRNMTGLPAVTPEAAND